MDKIAVIDAACAMRPGRPTMPWVTPQPKQLQLKLQILLQVQAVHVRLAWLKESSCLMILCVCLTTMSMVRCTDIWMQGDMIVTLVPCDQTSTDERHVSFS